MEGTQTAKLEADILAGKKVSPEQLAAAKASDEANNRIGELQEQRNQAEARKRRIAEAEAANAVVEADFLEFAKDTTIAKITNEIERLAFEYNRSAEARNEALAIFKTRSENVSGIANGEYRPTVVAESGSGDVYLRGGVRITKIFDSKVELERIFQAAVQKVVADVNERRAERERQRDRERAARTGGH